MVATKASYYTLVEVELDLWVARIECLSFVYFQYYHLMLPHCHLGIVVSPSAYMLEPYWLSSAENCLLTSYMNQMIVVNTFSIQFVIANAEEV